MYIDYMYYKCVWMRSEAYEGEGASIYVSDVLGEVHCSYAQPYMEWPAAGHFHWLI